MTPLGHRSAQSASRSATPILIVAGLSGLLWSISGGEAGAWPLVILGLGFIAAIRLNRTDFLRRTLLDLPLALFLGTAVVGIWAGYDPGAAQNKFWLLVGGYVLYYALAMQPSENLWRVAAVLAGLGVAVAVAFLLTHDWQASPAIFASLQRLGMAWMAVRPSPSAAGLHPNIAGGLMAILIPFQIAWIWRARRTQGVRGEKNRRRLLILAFAIALTILALLLTSSRGALLALVAALIVWMLWQDTSISRRFLQRHGRLFVPLIAIGLVAGIFALLSGWGWQAAQLLDRLPGPASAVGRARLAGQTIDLIVDFPFTGGGLAAFPGLHSHYILGIPFYYLPNGHNVILDVTLEQGIPATVALIIIITATFWLLVRHNPRQTTIGASRDTGLLAGATLSSFLILLLHGMVEDTVYGSAALPLLFTAPGLAHALNWAGLDRETRQQQASQLSRWQSRTVAVLAIAALALISILALPSGRALWWANLGAVSMARAQLADFPSGKWAQSDQAETLKDAEVLFQRSLHLHPQQRTAQYRMGMIAMLRRDYDSATGHLEITYAQDSDHIGVRKALGYSYAWSGNVERGRQMLGAVPFVTQELVSYTRWWRGQGCDDLAETAAEMLTYFRSANDRTVIQ